MRIVPKTWVLLILALVLLGMNVLDRGGPVADTLPALPAVERDAATRIEITSVTEKMIIEKTAAESWQITAPFEYQADLALVQNVLGVFRQEVPVDVQVDTGNEETYGLTADHGLVLEIWTAGDEPVVSVTIGFDSVGGSSFVRLSGDDAVYRARVGGRPRYELPPAAWRNRALVAVDPALVVAYTVVVPFKGPLVRLVREPPGAPAEPGGEPTPAGEWLLDPDPGWPVDQQMVNLLIGSLARLRADDILDPGFDGGFAPPAAEVTMTMADGMERRLTVGSKRVAGAAYAKVPTREEVFKVPPALFDNVVAPVTEFRDKTLLRFDPAQVDTMTLQEGSNVVVLRQDLATRLWHVIQPRNIDTDQKDILFAVQTLSNLRSRDLARVGLPQAGLDRPPSRFELTFHGGGTASIEVGGPVDGAADLVYVRRSGSPAVHMIEKATVDRLRTAFGRG